MNRPFTKKQLLQQAQEIMDAKTSMEKMMASNWPKGSHLFVRVQSLQIRPTGATVLCYYGPYLRVRLDTEKQKVKDIHINDIWSLLDRAS